MSWNSIKDLAQQRIEDKGMNTKIQESLVIEQANSIVADFFGKEAAKKARAVYFKNGLLTIAVLSRELCTEIESQKGEFINILNHKLAEDIVYDLRFLS